MKKEDIIWAQKYRPKKIKDCVLPEDLKILFSTYAEKKNMPNLLLAGSQGVGKTTVAKALLNEIDADYIEINGSLDGNIDTLRVTISNFASTVSFTNPGGRKWVLIDEGDFLNPNSTQPALRNFIEEYSKNCGFIITANYKDKIRKELQSRFSLVDFAFKSSDKNKLMVEFLGRMTDILEKENIEYDKAALAQLIHTHYPDFRKILNETQRYSITGKIDAGILTNMAADSFDDLVQILKDRKFMEMRKWVGLNPDVSFANFVSFFDENCEKLTVPDSIPQLGIILNDHQFKAAFVVNQSVNMVSCLTDMMADVKWL